MFLKKVLKKVLTNLLNKGNEILVLSSTANKIKKLSFK